jgi:hypothetical protein
MTWVLEAFRDSDELLAWELDLPGAEQAVLAERLDLPGLDTSGGFRLTRAQARAAAAFATPEARQAVELDAPGLDFFISSYSESAAEPR